MRELAEGGGLANCTETQIFALMEQSPKHVHPGPWDRKSPKPKT